MLLELIRVPEMASFGRSRAVRVSFRPVEVWTGSPKGILDGPEDARTYG